jgi:4-amino-4-deoxy-L-arabinose transferase-like glycosyltransferase
MAGGTVNIKRLGVVAGLAVLGVVLIARLAVLNTAHHDADEFMFALGGRNVLQGVLPPAGLFDNKPVGLLYLFALAELIGGQTVAAIHSLGLISASVAAYLIYLSLRDLRLSSAPAVAIVAFASVELVSLGGWLTMSEVVALPFLAGANLLLLRAEGRALWLLGAGAVFGLACQTTYLMVPVVAFSVAAVALDLDPSGLERAVLLAVGCACSALAVWLPQIIQGGLLANLQEQLAYQTAYRLEQPSGAKIWVAVVLPALAFLQPFLVGALDHKAVARVMFSRTAMLLALQTLGAILAATASNRFFSHYLILAIPALSLLLGVMLSGLSRRHAWLGTAAVLFCSVVFLIPSAGLFVGWGHAADFERQAAALVKGRVGQDGPILVFNETPMIYYLSGSRIATRYPFADHYMPGCIEVPMSTPDRVLAEGISRHAALILIGGRCASELDARSIVQKAGYVFTQRLSHGERSLDVYALPAIAAAHPTTPHNQR